MLRNIMTRITEKMGWISRHREIIIVLVILLTAVFMRFWQIDRIPPGLYPDEAVNGNDALRALNTGDYKVFYPDNNGREGLFIALQSLSLAAFGPNVWALRIVSAVFGTLTILGLYLLAKELFGKRPAYFAAFFAAVSFWHINFSRIGFRAIMVPFFIVFTFYFLFKALINKKVRDFALAGIFLGLGLYTYLAFRFVPILAALVLAIYFKEWWHEHKIHNPDPGWWWHRFYFKEGFWKWDIFLLAAILVFLPLGIYFLQHTQDFFGRASQVSIFHSPNIWKEFGLSSFKSFSKYFWGGDYNWRHNLSGAPQLLWPVGLLFLIGFAVSIRTIIRSKFKVISHWFLILGFFLLSLPEILTNESLPHCLRSIGTIPFVFIFAGLGARFILSQIHYKKASHKAAFNALIVLVLGAVGFLSAAQYFYLYDNRTEVKAAFSQDLVDIGNYLNGLPASVKKTVIVNQGGIFVDNVPMPAQTVKFITYQKSEVTYLTEEMIDPQKVDSACREGGVIIPMSYDDELWNRLTSLLANRGQIDQINNIWAFNCR